MENIAVIDYGCQSIKAGYAYNFPGEDQPSVITPCAVEVDAPSSSGRSPEVHFPVHGGKITNFDEFESLIHYVLYSRLGWIMGQEGNVVLTEPILTSRPDRERVTQLMFEVFNANGVFIQDQPVCSLYAAGKTSGLVVDVGHSKVDVSTVTEGLLNSSSATRLPYGGEQLTQYLDHLLAQRGIKLSSLHDVEVLKEQCAKCADSSLEFRVAMNAGHTGSSNNPAPTNETYKLPDGQEVRIQQEGLMLGEALFNPTLLGLNNDLGIAETAFVVASTQDTLLKKVSFETMLVCGGSSVIPGLSSRFYNEVSSYLPPGVNSIMCGLPEYMPQPHSLKHSAWMGAAILAKVVMQSNQFVGKADYEEAGPGAIQRKCS